MTLVLWVGLGGALGSSSRYVISHLIQENTSSGFPFGTFTVNIIGCLIIGFLVGLSIHRPESLSEQSRFLLSTGFCGGFTTFSAFSAETFSLIDKGEFTTAILYVILSIFVGLLATGMGIIIIK
ncbi:MAG TPA: fluoride efflux transporter CrcB [Bacteroidetes bacterium]|nr:fluoride efflux transporter CrcB [Bacteroidota bacterium]